MRALWRNTFSMLLVAAVIATGTAVRADVTLHGLFTDNMVLQRGMPVAVYGAAADGEAVTVEIAGQKATATAAGGQWKATLSPMEAGGPHTMTVTGKNAIALKNVMVGDVWLCTGQSNMAGILRSYKGEGYKDYQHLYEGIPSANPMIRLFKLENGGADEPRSEVTTDKAFGATWRECDEAAALEFSATGYLFGRRLQPEIGVPVGLIYATLGGTSAQSWVSRDVLAGMPECQDIFAGFEAAVKAYPAAFEQYEKRLAEWKAKKPEERKGTKAPQEPMGPTHMKRPSGLYNYVIAPLQQFAIKGAIWYQGEGNAGQAVQYRTLFPALITSWRKQWGQGDFPFLFVQLAAYRQMNPEPEDTDWAWLREAQAMTLSLPATGMAVIIDAGHQGNIHPPNKPVVGERLALSALKVAYGRDVVASGPTFKSLAVRDGKAIVTFDNVGGGLAPKDVDLDGHKVSAAELKGFSICGKDKKFKWASAAIEGDTVVVSSPEVKEPVAVRYAWSDFPLCNLYNKEGLPAGPFRTDQFERVGTGAASGIAIGKPFVCSHKITNGLYTGLTDGDLRDTNKTAYATNGSKEFPKMTTVDLQGKFDVTAIRVHNSAFGGTKTVDVQVSSDGQAFRSVGKTEFKNYTPDVFELADLKEAGVSHVRLVFPDIYEIGFQKKPMGFVFLRELEVEGTPAQP